MYAATYSYVNCKQTTGRGGGDAGGVLVLYILLCVLPYHERLPPPQVLQIGEEVDPKPAKPAAAAAAAEGGEGEEEGSLQAAASPEPVVLIYVRYWY